MSDHSQWIEAATVLIADPTAQVLCPKCGVAILAINDERLDDEHIDRHLKCPNCGAHETVLKKVANEKSVIEWLRLIFDNWSGNDPNEVTVQRPAWPQLEAAINALDGDRRTCLTLCAEDDGPEIVIGGGPEKFVVSVAFSDEEIYTLKDKAKPSATVLLTTGGQTGAFTEQETWERPVAIEAAQYFYTHGKTHPALPWMKVGEGG